MLSLHDQSTTSVMFLMPSTKTLHFPMSTSIGFGNKRINAGSAVILSSAPSTRYSTVHY